ncbi:MAG: hypothetical protein WCH46_10035 [bacterium]
MRESSQKAKRLVRSYVRIGLIVTVLLGAVAFAGVASGQDLENIGDQKPVSLDGSITFSGTKYSVAGANPRRPPTSWSIVGSPTLGIYGITFPFTFIISDQESSTRQPFDQFGVSPSYKWLTLHVGYQSLTYSKYTLAGITFLGGGIDINPSPLRLSVMYGRFQRAVEVDTAPPTSTYSYAQPAYKRMGLAVKAGYGSDASFVDFIYLHAKDDSASLLRKPDSLNIFPTENSVFALNTHVKIIDALALEGEVSASLLTRDVRSQKLDSTSIPSLVSSIVDVKSSSSLLLAANAGIVLTLPHFSTRFSYERIEPDYNSLGAFYFTSDIENFLVAPSFDLFDNKFRVSGSVGIQNDNILSTRIAKTQRVIGSGNMSINPSQVFGLDLNYTNYSTSQGASKLPGDTGQYLVRNVSQSASVTPRLLFLSSETSNSFILSVSQQQYTDYNLYTQGFSNSLTTTGSFNYSLSLLKSGLNTGISLLYATTKQGATNIDLIGATLNASKSLLDNTLSLGGSFGITISNVRPIAYTSNTFSESINCSYRILTHGTLSLNIYANETTSTSAGSIPFTEVTATLSYSHNFSF